MSPSLSRRRSFTSTAMIRRRLSSAPRWRPNTVRSSISPSSSTCSAIGGSATTKATSRRSPSRSCTDSSARTRRRCRSTPTSSSPKASSLRARSTRCAPTGVNGWRRNSRLANPIPPTRPIGSTAAGRASRRRGTSPTTIAAARPASISIGYERSASASRRRLRASTFIRPLVASSRTVARQSRSARGSTGRPPRRSPLARCWTRAFRFACPARTASAARSRSAIRC